MQERIRVVWFIVVLCSFCAALLAGLSLLLGATQKQAQELDQNRQLLIAAKILSPEGYFLIPSSNGVYLFAKWDQEAEQRVASMDKIRAKDEEILAVYEQEIHPKLVDDKGNLLTFEEAHIDEQEYRLAHQKEGYAHLPLKLIFEIGRTDAPAEGYVIPVNGYGLWDAIYGYIALKNDGNTVLGTTWYEHKETAGLGANITLPSWQAQFFGKRIFPENERGTTFPDSPIGIFVVKGKVAEHFANSPKARNAVDGISGASMTGKGVTNAYAESLEPYKPFLLKLKNNPHPS